MNKRLSTDTRQRIKTHIDNLGNPHAETAAQAERRLIRFGSKAVDALLDVVDSSNPQIRFRAVWALGKIGDARAFAKIIERTADPDDRVSYDAILALGELGDNRAVPRLQELANGPSTEAAIDSAAQTALVKLGVRSPEDDEAP